jgi:hypothetical protein
MSSGLPLCLAVLPFGSQAIRVALFLCLRRLIAGSFPAEALQE